MKIINSKRKESGFTLVELLVTISVISLMASIMLVGYNRTRMKARDTKRIADMRQLQTALDLYYNNNNSVYPGKTSTYGEEELGGMLDCGGWDTSAVDFNSDGRPFISPLQSSGVISKVPNDPLGKTAACSQPYGYRYFLYPSDYCVDRCIGKAFYILGVNAFENPGAFSSPGFSCTQSVLYGGALRDWGTEFAWVTGKCE